MKMLSCVKQGQALSNFFSCDVGVRQGENSSLLLFAIYLNDFEYSVSRNYRDLTCWLVKFIPTSVPMMKLLFPHVERSDNTHLVWVK